MGQRLLNYEVLERLGEGARSTIYLVQDPETGRKYALKHVKRDDQKDIRFIEQMESEFEISRQFNHPNLRRTYELKINKTLLLKVNEAYLVMELVDGRPLDGFLPTDLLEVLETFTQAAQGLKYMHNLGFVHCDIKPNNILRNEKGAVKVIDYGQSCKVGTVKERIQGTPDYIAPEQVARRPVTIQTDIFNLGATLYWAVSGKTIPTLYTTSKKGDNSLLSDDLITQPIQLNPTLPSPVNLLVMDMIATNPRKRPTDMDEVIRRLELGKHMIETTRNPSPTKPDPSSLSDTMH
ncbi:MAG TPA: serine/threonine-protein kinase [Tepidisphaeraceae bacterium]|nr:serine/threonine-protein kinase [Tepidisphaeraceae bacterium]